ncbi:MAG: TonB-dependent receptor [Proteobacteria bacterium]|nr:TonB-dependent receptor [Pseudomonadota bacterium]
MKQVSRIPLVQHSLTVGVTAAGLAFGAMPALGQQSDQAQPALEEIVVTAQRREEKLNTVPISVSALSEAHLEQMGAKDIGGFARDVPGLSVQPATNGGAPAIAIRGISSAAGDATVGIYIDDTPVQAPKSSFSADPMPKLFDIDRVEVLRGPQGTLFGSSSEGGTIRYITPTPSLTEFSGKVRSEVGFTESGAPSYEVGAAAGGPAIEGALGLRGSVYYRRDGGYIDRVSRLTGDVIDSNVNRSDSVSLRLAANLTLPGGLQILPAVYYQRRHSEALPLTYSTLGPFQQANTVPSPGDDRFVLPSLTVNYDVGSARLTSVTSYFDRRDVEQFDYSLITMDTFFHTAILPGFESYQSTSRTRTSQQNFTQELRVSSAAGASPFNYTVGAFYQHALTRFAQQVAEPGLETVSETLFGAPLAAVAGIGLLPGGLSYEQSSYAVEEQTAGFGELSYNLTSHLKLAGGVRVAHIKVSSQFNADGLYNGGPTTPDLLGVQTSSETPVNPKGTISYQFDDSNLAYITASRGFRSGGPNTPVPVGRCGADLAAQGTTPEQLRKFESDSVWNYEVGAKTLTLDRRLALNASVFYIDWRNIQQALALPLCGFGYVANLGHATSKGFDFQGQYKLVEGLTLGANVGYSHSVLKDNVYAGLNAITGERALITREGDATLLSPQWTSNVTLTYEHALAAGYSGYLRTDLQHSSAFRRTTSEGTAGFDPALYAGPAYNFLTLRSGVVHGSLDLSFFVDNVTNARPVLYASYGLDSISRQIQQQTTLRPRSFGIDAGYRF